MNALIQLLRRPAFLVTILVLLTVSSGFFILSSGVFFSTLAVSDEMEQRFVVAAFPTDELVRYSKKFDNAEILYYDSAMFESERIALSNIIKDPGLAEQVYHLKFSCGYSPELRSLVSAEFPGKYQIYGEKDYPYFRNTVLLAEIKEIKEPVTVRTSFPLVDSTGEVEYRRGVRVFVELSAELQEVISLHPGYKVRDKIRATLNFDSMEEYRNAGLEEGRRFYFIGEFNDISLARITENFVRLNLPHEGIRLEDHLRMLTEEELEEHYISDLDCRYVIPYSRDSEYPSEVRKAAESAERTHHSFPVLGTDYLERLYEFHLGELFLTEGRSFTRQEYESGETLCIISEQMAQINGLTVGDKIPLSFFLTEEKLRGILLFYRHPNYVLSHEIEHQGEVGEPREFRIIGLYRAKNVWNFDFFSITPNTVFIPNKAMPLAHLKLDRGHFQTIVVNRDAVEAFQDKMKESRIRSSVVSVHDNGYAE